MLKLRLFFVGATLGLMLCSCKHPCQIDALGGACWITRCEEGGEDLRSCNQKWQARERERAEQERKLKARERALEYCQYDALREACWIARCEERGEDLRSCYMEWGARERERVERERAEQERLERERAERERAERAERQQKLKRCEKEMGIRGEACFEARERAKRERAGRELAKLVRAERAERAERERAERQQKLKRCEKKLGIRGEACLEKFAQYQRLEARCVDIYLVHYLAAEGAVKCTGSCIQCKQHPLNLCFQTKAAIKLRVHDRGNKEPCDDLCDYQFSGNTYKAQKCKQACKLCME